MIFRKFMSHMLLYIITRKLETDVDIEMNHIRMIMIVMVILFNYIRVFIDK
jgi:hypothetical protein